MIPILSSTGNYQDEKNKQNWVKQQTYFTIQLISANFKLSVILFATHMSKQIYDMRLRTPMPTAS